MSIKLFGWSLDFHRKEQWEAPGVKPVLVVHLTKRNGDSYSYQRRVLWLGRK